MAYPTLPIAISSTSTRIDGYEAVRASNGALKVRKMMAAEKMEFDLVHELTSAQRDTLESHFTGNRTASFSFAWPTTGVSYTVVYVAAPLHVEQPGGWYKTRVRLAEV